jgi:hypothetical protein
MINVGGAESQLACQPYVLVVENLLFFILVSPRASNSAVALDSVFWLTPNCSAVLVYFLKLPISSYSIASIAASTGVMLNEI